MKTIKGVVYKVWLEVEECNESEDRYDNVELMHGPLAKFESCDVALQFVDGLHERATQRAMNWNEVKHELVQAIFARDIERIGQMANRLRFEGKLNYDQCFEVAHELTGIEEGDWDEILYEADQQ